jgi:hypothetical protein
VKAVVFANDRFYLHSSGGYYHSPRTGRRLGRVVWEAANGQVPVGCQIRHRNGNKSDYRLENLECFDGRRRLGSLIEASKRGPGECWPWAGAMHREGYGDHSGMRAHRRVYLELVGPVADGMHLHHVCENKACVNPAHLKVVDGGEHVRGHKRMTHCRNGHELTPENAPYHFSRTVGRFARQCRRCAIKRKRTKAGLLAILATKRKVGGK